MTVLDRRVHALVRTSPASVHRPQDNPRISNGRLHRIALSVATTAKPIPDIDMYPLAHEPRTAFFRRLNQDADCWVRFQEANAAPHAWDRVENLNDDSVGRLPDPLYIHFVTR